MLPVSSPSTVTRARETRWTTARTVVFGSSGQSLLEEELDESEELEELEELPPDLLRESVM